eukprot:scaffold117480_cov34-Prasinocladus_malaysianus.AAC.1
MTWVQTGEKFTGNWADGLPHGLGEHVWYGSSLVPMRSNHAQFLMHNRYVGQLVQGRREGEGTFYYSTGARYEGRWVNNKKHGEGVFVFDDGTVFVGSFENDRSTALSLQISALRRPLNIPSEKFGPEDPGPKVYVDDLLVRCRGFAEQSVARCQCLARQPQRANNECQMIDGAPYRYLSAAAEEPDSELAYKAVLKVTALCTDADSPGILIFRAQGHLPAE